jgi:hypothetical protein
VERGRRALGRLRAAVGTPSTACYGKAESPDCGYMYATTSGQQGDITTTRTSGVPAIGPTGLRCNQVAP